MNLNNENSLEKGNSSKIIVNNIFFLQRKLQILQGLYKYTDKKEKVLSSLLHISESALKSHKRELFEITNTSNTPYLIKFGIQNGLIIL